MIKIIIEILFGFSSTIAGFYAAFLYIKSQENASNYFFLIPVIPLIIIGIKLLFRATERISYGESVPDPLAKLGTPEEDNALEKNKEILDEWKKTTNNQAKLETLKLEDEIKKESAL